MEILYSIVPGGASAIDIEDGRPIMAGVHFVQDVGETLLIFGKLAKLSKFSKLSRLGALGERFNKNAKAAYAAIAITELIGAGASGIQAGQDFAAGKNTSGAVNSLQVLFGIIGFGTSAAEYLKAAEKAATASAKLAASAKTLERIVDTYSVRKAAELASKPTSARRVRISLGRLGMLDSRQVVIRTRAAEDFGAFVKDFGSFRRIDVILERDRRGRVVIYLTENSLKSLKEAVFTIGHELKHIKDYLAGLENSAEAAANFAGSEFLEKFLDILRRSAN
ncbi:MAG: hypothetical protein O2856_12635 [Planctomycetota bacterium]|nr:hypothetical protein [Planctomycetota bacterium]